MEKRISLFRYYWFGTLGFVKSGERRRGGGNGLAGQRLFRNDEQNGSVSISRKPILVENQVEVPSGKSCSPMEGTDAKTPLLEARSMVLPGCLWRHLPGGWGASWCSWVATVRTG